MELPVELIGSPIDRGTILHSSIFEYVDHGKYFVVIGVSGECVVGFFFINSNISHTIWNKQDQLDMQYPLKKSDYGFLRYDSFLCCTNILRINKSDLIRSIQDGRTSYIGELLPRHREEILELVRNSKLFSKIEKEEFFYR